MIGALSVPTSDGAGVTVAQRPYVVRLRVGPTGYVDRVMSGSGDFPIPAVGFVALLRLREYRFLWLADVQSMLGDQLARVALSVLVYDRTRSALVTAVVYALSFLPALVGSVLLGPLADRLPRRSVLVGGDLIRAVLLGLMALPNMPVPVLAALLVLVVLVGTPWSAAESALVVDVLNARDYALGIGLRSATGQAAQVAGFAVGGVTVAALGARGALALDTATFLISAMIIQLGVRSRPAAAQPQQGESHGSQRWLAGTAVVLRNHQLRLLLAMSWLLGLLVVPEGLAAPYAQLFDGAPRTVGLLLAAGPAGVLLGTVLYSRWLSASARTVLLGPMAAVSGLPLLACAATPGLALTCLLWALSGACTAYQVQVVTEFVGTVAAVGPTSLQQAAGQSWV
ncbi:MAG: MFS transporter, partial [Actinomycetota bacterium]|nr:MFS transporter [Actinomycetota bacterium]